MELRQFYNQNRYSYEKFVVNPLDIPDFKLLGKSIEVIDGRKNFINLIIKLLDYQGISNTKDSVEVVKDFSNFDRLNTYIEPLPQKKKKKSKKKQLAQSDDEDLKLQF